jgi:tetratricopeptide (TPR) repeat protein
VSRIFQHRTWAACLIASACFVSGCSDRGTGAANPSTAANVEAQQREVGERLFKSAVDMLDRLDDYDESQVESAVAQVVRRLNESFAAESQDGVSAAPFEQEDGKSLRELVWLREAAEFAVGDETDPLKKAQKLADWTVRNIQLIPDDAPAAERLPYLPWHILILGRGTQFDRAWLFTLLARQQNLDAVLVTFAEKPTPAGDVAAAVLHNGKLYPVDLVSGLPAPQGEKGPVSLDEIIQGVDAGFAKLLFSKPPSEASPSLFVEFDASQLYTSTRFSQLENKLTGDSKLVLSVDTGDLKARLEKCPGVKQVVAKPLRDERFRASREPATFALLLDQLKAFHAPPVEGGSRITTSPIWRARVRHITGKYVDPEREGPPLTRLYQEARPAETELKALRSNSAIWTYAYRIKQNATYWLGLVSYDLKNYETAVQYFDLVLKDKANGGWTAGARYNLGRTYEAWGKPEEAIRTYRATFLDLPPDEACEARAAELEAAKK